MVLAFTRPQNLVKYMVLAVSKPKSIGKLENTWFWLSTSHKAFRPELSSLSRCALFPRGQVALLSATNLQEAAGVGILPSYG